MPRNLLHQAADEVDTAEKRIPDTETSDRLEVLAEQLRSQANRETTPALGVLDRIHTKLREIEHQTDETAVNESLEHARDDISSFLETLDDRGMKQH